MDGLAGTVTQGAFLGPLAAIASAMTWAFGSVAYSAAARKHPTFVVNQTRALIALPLFVAASLLFEGTEEWGRITSEHWGWVAVSMVSSYGLGDVLFLSATHRLGVPVALAIASCFPIWATLLQRVSGGPELSLAQCAGLSLVLGFGVFVILTSATTLGLPRKGLWRGISFAGLTTVFWAINGWAASHLGRGLGAATANSMRMVVAWAISAGLGFAWYRRRGVRFISLRELGRDGWLFAGEAFLGSYLFLYGLGHSDLVVGTTLSSLAPVISAPAAVIMGLERWSWRRMLGVAGVVTGIVLLVSG